MLEKVTAKALIARAISAGLKPISGVGRNPLPPGICPNDSALPLPNGSGTPDGNSVVYAPLVSQASTSSTP